MKFERVGRVAVRDLRFQICWQVDDVDGLERTPVTEGPIASVVETPLGRCEHVILLLRADTATDTELLRNERDLCGRVDFDTEFT